MHEPPTGSAMGSRLLDVLLIGCVRSSTQSAKCTHLDPPLLIVRSLFGSILE